VRDEVTPRSQFAWAFRKLPPADPPSLLQAEVIARRFSNRRAQRQQQRIEDHALAARDDAEKRAWIEAGNDLRQPPEYRGTVFDHADHAGVHPSPFPPYRDELQGPLSEAFVDFQNYATQTPETHPRYFCVQCKIRHNARDGGRCGRCIRDSPTEYPS
jgi:hypothetical protein